MDHTDAAVAYILADCATDDNPERQIMKHATIIQRLVCHLVKDLDHAEAHIGELYSDLAHLAVEHIGDSRVFPGRKLH
jgi:hypothetical protein